MCYACGTELPAEFVITRSAECPTCGKPVRVCKNCEFYEPGAHWDCRETVPEQVVDKERSNFCDYFRANRKTSGDSDHSDAARSKARADFDALFS